MPAFTVTAVDTTNNTLTAAGVAAVAGAPGAVLLTGDRLRLRNVGGALPAATPALAPVTDYFAIRVDDNTIKVSDTNAHALAGTGIVDLTGAGSGTTTIEFGLPYCIPTQVMVPGVSQVKSVDLNGSWAALVALYDLLTAQAQAVWSVVTLAVSLVINGSLTVTGLFNKEQTWQHSIAFALPDASASLSLGVAGTTATRLSLQTSTGDNVLPLNIPVGTITKWSITLSKTSATGTITGRIYECANANGVGVTQIGATQTNSANNPGAITLGQTGLSFAMTSGREYFLVLNGGGVTGDQATSYFAAVTGT